MVATGNQKKLFGLVGIIVERLRVLGLDSRIIGAVDEEDGCSDALHGLKRGDVPCLEFGDPLRSAHGNVAQEMPRQLDDPLLVIDHDRSQVRETCLCDNDRDALVDGRRLQSDGSTHGGSENTDVSDPEIISGHQNVDRSGEIMLFVVAVGAIGSAAQSVTTGVVQKHVESFFMEELRVRNPTDFAITHTVQVDDRPTRLPVLPDEPAAQRNSIASGDRQVFLG